MSWTMTSDDPRACTQRRSASLSLRSQSFNLVFLGLSLGLGLGAPLALRAGIIYGLSHAKCLVKTTNTHCSRFYWWFSLTRKTCNTERTAKLYA